MEFRQRVEHHWVTLLASIPFTCLYSGRLCPSRCKILVGVKLLREILLEHVHYIKAYWDYILICLNEEKQKQNRMKQIRTGL